MRLWVNEDRTVLVREHPDGSMEVATRPEAGAIWGPPITVRPDGGNNSATASGVRA